MTPMLEAFTATLIILAGSVLVYTLTVLVYRLGTAAARLVRRRP